VYSCAVFSTRQTALYAIAHPARLSVHQTGGSVKMVEVRIMQLAPQSSPVPLVFGI